MKNVTKSVISVYLKGLPGDNLPATEHDVEIPLEDTPNNMSEKLMLLFRTKYPGCLTGVKSMNMSLNGNKIESGEETFRSLCAWDGSTLKIRCYDDLTGVIKCTHEQTKAD